MTKLGDNSISHEQYLDYSALDCSLELETLLGLDLEDAGGFCSEAVDGMNAASLAEAIHDRSPFFARKDFCRFLGVGESTLSGWLKAGHMPQAAKAAWVLLMAFGRLQGEVRRLRRDAEDLKIVRTGDVFQMVRFKAGRPYDDETERRIAKGFSADPVGEVVARDIPDETTARTLAQSARALQLLEETRDVINYAIEMAKNGEFNRDEHLEDLDQRIVNARRAALQARETHEAILKKADDDRRWLADFAAKHDIIGDGEADGSRQGQ